MVNDPDVIIMSRQKKYYENHKEKIKERYSEIIKCECGVEVMKCNISKHKKSLKHLAALNINIKYPSDIICCDCGAIVNSSYYKKHMLTNKHSVCLKYRMNKLDQ